MGDLVLGEMDVVGDEDEGGHVLGARARGRLARGRVRVPTPGWMRATTSQGVSRPQEEMDFLPFTAASIAIGALTGTCTAAPQRPFRPERLIMTARDATGDVATNVVIDPAIFVGATQVGASQGSTPITAFAANAFGVRLSMPSTGQGTDLRIPVRLLVASASITNVTAVLIGRAMR